MPSGTITVDPSVLDTVPQVKSNVLDALLFSSIDIDELSVSYFQTFILISIISLSTYLAYVLSALLRLKIFKFILSIIFPAIPLLGCLAICLYAYIASCVYAELLSDKNRSIVKYMYVCLLGGVYLPLAVFMVNLMNSLYFIFFIGVGLYSEYFCRSSLTMGRHFEDKKQRNSFILMSMLLNIGFYVLILPLFFTH